MRMTHHLQLLTLKGFFPQVLAALADNAKHNQQGCVDEHGACQHHLVALCPVGAISRLFFAFFHIMEQPCPSFSPNFTADGYGEYGYRKWYDYHVFASSQALKAAGTSPGELFCSH